MAISGRHHLYLGEILHPDGNLRRATSTAGTLLLQGNYEAQLWNDREYVAGQNGEASPIRTQDHDDYRGEGGNPPRLHHLAHATMSSITTAPGESFRDSLTSSDPLAGYDPSKGVAIRNTRLSVAARTSGIDVHDNFVDLIGLQIKSVHGAAVNGMSSYGNYDDDPRLHS